MSSLKELIAKKKSDIAERRAGYQRTYKLKPGKTRFRLLPGWETKSPDDPGEFSVPFGLHWIKGKDGSVLANKAVACAAVCYGMEDPIRNAVSEAARLASVDDTYRKELKDGLASNRVLVNAAVMSDKDQSTDEAVLMEFSEKQFESILGILEEFVENDINPFALDGGLELVVDKQGSGLKTTYTFTGSPRCTALKEGILGTIQDLPLYVKAQFEGQASVLTALSKEVGVTLGGPVTSAALTSTASYGGPGAGAITHETETPVTATVITGDAEDGQDAQVVNAVQQATAEQAAEEAVVEEAEVVEEEAAATTAAPSSADADEIEDILNSL